MRALLVAALIGLAAALTAPTAANASACWQRVLQDWRDGRIDAVYPVQCYRDALENMPEDLRVYGTAENDIQAALARALARTAAESHEPRQGAARPAAKPKAAPTSVKPKVASAAKPHGRAAARTPAPARDRTRTLAGRSETQPKLRLAAAPAKDSAAERFPVAVVVAGALALGAAFVALAVARGRASDRR